MDKTMKEMLGIGLARGLTTRNFNASNSDLSEIVSRDANSYKKSKTVRQKVNFLGDDLVKPKATSVSGSRTPVGPRTEVLIVTARKIDDNEP